MTPTMRSMAALGVVAVAGVGGWALGRVDQAATRLPPGVESVTVARGDIAIAVSLTGIVVPRDRVLIHAQTDGRVARVRAEPGSIVNAGDPLLDLDSADATVDLSRTTLERRLAELEADEGERHKIALALARLTERKARERLNRHVVRAPSRGRLTEINAVPGDMVGPSTGPVAIVMAGDAWDVEVEADEFDVAGIRVGAASSTMVPAHSSVPCVGEVRTEPRLARVRTGVGSPALFRLRIGLSCDVPPRASGLSAYVEVERQRRDDVLLVPLSAIVRHDGQEHVVVVRGDAFDLRPVTLGLTDVALAEIAAGLVVDDRVLAGPEALLRAAVRTPVR
jgi:multidrug efflux pump subunit AcrA (membrane-fusion protein)